MRRLISLLLVLALLSGLLPASGGASQVAARTLGKRPMAPQALCPSDLIISEYVEGNYSNKAVEIFNGTGAPVDLSGYRLTLYTNGSTTPGNTYDFSGTLDAGGVFVIANPGADAAILAVADATDDVTYFNGNDALVLDQGGSVVDSIGDVGNADYWGSEMTLVRDPSVMAGDTIVDDDFVIADEWLTYGQNTFDYLGSHTLNPCGEDLSLIKSAPSEVWVGDVFTYTLVASNDGTGLTLTDLVITDTLPLSVTVDTISDGGVQIGDMVSWTVASLDLGSSVTRTVSVMAPDVNTLLSNSDYAVVASNWTTPTVGPVVETAVGGQLVDIGVARGMDDELVRVSGRATMYTGGFYAGSDDAKFYIQDATGGISIQCFDDYGPPQDVTLGDLVTVTGRVADYQGEVQVVPEDNVNDVVITDGLPEDVPAPMDMTVAALSAPAALGWLARLHGQITRLDEYLYNYSLDLFDGTGTVEIYVDKNTGIDLSGLEVYDDYQVTGIAEAYYTTNELNPRIQDDFVHVAREILRVYKSAPAYVLSGLPYSYELLVTNNTTDTLNNVVLTDTLPADVTLAEVLDGGVQVGNTVSWTVPTLASGESFTAGFVVTATGAVGVIVLNDDYGALADEWPVLATGPDVATKIVSCGPGATPIYQIQGSGAASPMAGDPVTVCGVVIGVAPALSGFFVQDIYGDGDSATSDGIFVYRSSQPFDVFVGDLVEVDGDVSEYNGVTEIYAGSSGDVLTVLASDLLLPSPVSLDPPPDRAAADTYLEAVEGMLVDVPVTVTVVGPTNAYGEYYFVRGDTGLDRLVRSIDPPDGYRLGVDDGIVTSDDYVVGDVLDAMVGPLHYTYDEWKIEQMHQPTGVSLVIVPGTLPQYPPDEPGQVTMASFNVLNFDGLDDVVKLNKVVTSIVAMGGPDILSLEEITAIDTWNPYDSYTVTAVLDDLVTALAAQGYTYAFEYSHPDSGGHGVAVLYNPAVFTLDGMTTLQDCSSVGSGSSTYDPIWDTCQASGDFPLFSRRPVVLTGTLSMGASPTPLTFIGAHLKSGIGDPDDEQRRLEQAQLIAAFVADVQAGGQERVILAGDLNDFLGSAPMLALQNTGMLTDTFYTLQPEERYSYIYNGVSQVLDHIMVSGALFDEMERFMPLHIDADYPAGWEADSDEVFGVSDHDPVLATFTLVPQAELTLMKSVVPTVGVYPGDLVTYTLTLSNSSALAMTNVVLTDVLPWEVNFLGWLENPAGATVTDDVISWSGTLAAEAMLEMSFVASVRTDTALIPHSVVNTAQVTADNVALEEDSATFELAGGASMVLTKDVLAVDPLPGDLVTYTLTLDNSSQGVVGNVMMSDTLPQELDFVAWVQQSDADQVDDVITWSGDLSAGETVSIIFTAMVHDDEALYGQTITNTARYLAAGTLTGEGQAMFTVALEPALGILKSVSPETNVALGGTVTYTLRLSNPVTTSATGIVFTDVLPLEVDFGGWVLNPGATQAGDVVSWSGDLAAEVSLTFIFTATVHDDEALYGQSITNTVTFSADNDLSGEDSATFTVMMEPSDILVTKTVLPAADVPLGSVVTYTIRLTNTVATTADGVLMTDTLPSAVTFGGWVGTAPAGTLQAGDMITWTGSLAQGSPLTFVFTATVGSDVALAGQTVVNTASFTSADAGSGSATASFTVEGGEEDYLVFLPLVMRNTP